MEFNLEDFFPMYYKINEEDNYYGIESDEFYNSILNKKEFSCQLSWNAILK